MWRCSILAFLILVASVSYADTGVRAVVHLSSYEDGTTQFIYINDGRLLVANYNHDPLEAFWKEVPEWSERAVTTEEIDKFVSVVSQIVVSWDTDYNGLEEGEKICRDFAWGVKIDSQQFTFDSSGICKEPDNFSDLVAEVTALTSGSDLD